MHVLKALRNQRGDTLVMVMVAAAIGMIVALGLASLMSSTQLTANNTQFRSDAGTLNEEMRALLSSSAACTNSFQGLVATAGASYNIITLFNGQTPPPPPTAAYTAGSIYGSNNSTTLLQSMTLSNFVAGGTPNTGQMTLTNTLSTAKKASGAQIVVRTINISVQTNATNQITSCIALAKMSDGIWQLSQANPNNIFYTGSPAPATGGNVGIGTANPNFALSIQTTDGNNTALRQNDGILIQGSITGLTAPSLSLLTATGLGTMGLALNAGDFSTWALPNDVIIGSDKGRLVFDTGRSAAPVDGIGRMIIDGNGNVGIGTSAPAAQLEVVSSTQPGFARGLNDYEIANDNLAARMGLLKSRGSPGAQLPVANMDYVGALGMGAWDGTQYLTTAGIGAIVNGAPAAGNVPTDLWFATTGGVNNVSPWASGLVRMVISSGGNVAIGTTSPSQRFQVGIQGDGTTAVANAWNTFSDGRLKNIVGRIPNACTIVDHLNGYYYKWKTGKDQSKQIGVIAQEVEAVLPELVKTGTDGMKTVDYPKLAAVFIEATKEHNREIAQLKADAAQKAKELADLKSYLCAKDPKAPVCK